MTADDRRDDATSVVSEAESRRRPYQWHTGRRREHGCDDAVEFIDVMKAFGRNRC